MAKVERGDFAYSFQWRKLMRACSPITFNGESG
jgi:hypothetical protein